MHETQEPWLGVQWVVGDVNLLVIHKYEDDDEEYHVGDDEKHDCYTAPLELDYATYTTVCLAWRECDTAGVGFHARAIRCCSIVCERRQVNFDAISECGELYDYRDGGEYQQWDPE